MAQVGVLTWLKQKHLDGRDKMLKRVCKLVGIGMVLLLLTLSLNHNTSYISATKKTDIVCPVYETGDSSENVSMPQFKIRIPTKSQKAILPINVPAKGIMTMILFDTYEGTEGYYDDLTVDVFIYEDANQTKLMDNKTCNSFLGVFYETFIFDNSGEYYLEILLSRNNGKSIERDINLCFMPALIMSGDRNMEEDTWVYGAINNNNSSYYKIETNEEGYFRLNMDVSESFSNNKLNVKLYDCKKKAITESFKIDKENNDLIFAVDPGDYFLEITLPSAESKKDFVDFRIRYLFTQIEDKSGAKFKDALPIELNGEEILGLQTLQNKKEKWYKVSIKNTKDLHLAVNKEMLEGDFIVELYDEKRNKIEINSETLIIRNNRSTIYRVPSKLKKGTYYIKVFKVDKNTSGSYSIVVYDKKNNNKNNKGNNSGKSF